MTVKACVVAFEAICHGCSSRSLRLSSAFEVRLVEVTRPTRASQLHGSDRLQDDGEACACLDEFDRILIEVLSVAAQQLLVVRQALVEQTQFIFEGNQIALGNTLGVFITMNPGYAGRTELPDNRKVLCRPVAMMVPDYGNWRGHALRGGCQHSEGAVRKFTKLYKLSSEQLSKRGHYDLGMRAIQSVLVMAGSLKRSDPGLAEDVLLLRAMRDSNVPMFLRRRPAALQRDRHGPLSSSPRLRFRSWTAAHCSRRSRTR